MMTRFFLAAGICLALTAATWAQPKAPTADPISTAAIDLAPPHFMSRGPGDSQIEIAFAPKPARSAERLVIKVIDSAQTSAFMAAYQMTSKPIADAMCRAAQRGVAVSAVLDARSNKHGDSTSKFDYMLSCGVDVKTNPRYPIMHDKFIVVDGRHVETGSFNFTFAAAERNAENAIVVWNNQAMAERYQGEFDRLFGEALD